MLKDAANYIKKCPDIINMSLFIFPPIFLDITVLHFKVRLWPTAVPKRIFILMNASHIYIIYLLESTSFNGSSYTSPKSLGCSIKMFVYSPGEFCIKKRLPPSFLQSDCCLKTSSLGHRFSSEASSRGAGLAQWIFLLVGQFANMKK